LLTVSFQQRVLSFAFLNLPVKVIALLDKIPPALVKMLKCIGFAA
jgi:hypothetical protein